MNDLLIPTVSPNKLIPFSDEKNIKQSLNDKSIRPIGCTYFLEDTRARTKYLALKCKEDMSFRVKGNDSEINYYMQTNVDGFLSSVLVGCETNIYENAIQITYPSILNLTSLWCFKYKRPVGIYAIDICDKKHNALWRMPNVIPDNIPTIDLPECSISNVSLSHLISIFKEGMNAISFTHKIQSYFKILEAYPNQAPFLQINNMYNQKGKSIKRKRLVVTEEMLKGAYDESIHKTFIGMKFTRVKQEINNIRNAISHPFIDNKFVEYDSFETQSVFAAYSIMLERISIEIIEQEIKNIISISEQDSSYNVWKSYLHI